MKNNLALFIFFSLFSLESVFSQSIDYEKVMNEITQMSNDYSGVLNTRQTWQVSYEGCELTDRYYFDNELTLVVNIDLANMDMVKVEERFINSIALYPKDENVDYLDVIRYENGRAEKIVDGVYYNLMVVPDLREKARRKMQQAIELCTK